MSKEFDALNRKIIQCTKCPRLAAYIREIASTKVRRHRDEEYWGKPVPGLGDQNAKIQVLGLAPAAHGATRTGRMFTGDASGDWLIKALYETGFANQPTSIHKYDGLKLKDIFISSSLRCAPPGNKPLKSELLNCREYFLRENQLLPQVKVIITLGRIAFDNFGQTFGLKLKFGHLITYPIQDNRILISSFHPSKQNTQTGKLLWKDWLEVFILARKFLDKSMGNPL